MCLHPSFVVCFFLHIKNWVETLKIARKWVLLAKVPSKSDVHEACGSWRIGTTNWVNLEAPKLICIFFCQFSQFICAKSGWFGYIRCKQSQYKFWYPHPEFFFSLMSWSDWRVQNCWKTEMHKTFPPSLSTAKRSSTSCHFCLTLLGAYHPTCVELWLLNVAEKKACSLPLWVQLLFALSVWKPVRDTDTSQMSVLSQIRATWIYSDELSSDCI